MPSSSRVIAVVLLALLVPVLPFILVGELPGERWLSARDESAAAFGLAGSALLASDVLLPIPSSLVGSMLGARLGASLGFVSAFAGLTLGSAVGYAAGRLAFSRIGAGAPSAPTLAVVFLSRPVPVLAEATSVAAGGTCVRFAPFLAISACGNAVYAAALTLSGAAFLPSGLLGPGLAVPMLLPLVGWYVWKKAGARRVSAS